MSTKSAAQKEAFNTSRRAKYATKKEADAAEKQAKAEAAALKNAKNASAKWNRDHPDDPRTVDHYFKKMKPVAAVLLADDASVLSVGSRNSRVSFSSHVSVVGPRALQVAGSGGRALQVVGSGGRALQVAGSGGRALQVAGSGGRALQAPGSCPRSAQKKLRVALEEEEKFRTKLEESFDKQHQVTVTESAKSKVTLADIDKKSKDTVADIDKNAKDTVADLDKQSKDTVADIDKNTKDTLANATKWYTEDLEDSKNRYIEIKCALIDAEEAEAEAEAFVEEENNGGRIPEMVTIDPIDLWQDQGAPAKNEKDDCAHAFAFFGTGLALDDSDDVSDDDDEEKAPAVASTVGKPKAPEMAAGTPSAKANKKPRLTPAKASFVGAAVSGAVSSIGNLVGWPKTPGANLSETTMDSPAKAMAKPTDSPAKATDSPAKVMGSPVKDVVGLANKENFGKENLSPTKEDIARARNYNGKVSFDERIARLEVAKADAQKSDNLVGVETYQKEINAIKIVAAEAPSAKKTSRSAMKPPRSAMKPRTSHKAPKSAAKAKAPTSAAKATPAKATSKKAKAGAPTPTRRSTRSNTPARYN